MVKNITVTARKLLEKEITEHLNVETIAKMKIYLAVNIKNNLFHGEYDKNDCLTFSTICATTHATINSNKMWYFQVKL